MPKYVFLGGFLVVSLLKGALSPNGTPAKSPDQVIGAYVRALGGESAVKRIGTREIHAQRHHGPKLVYYWQAPSKVLLVEGKKKAAYDGAGGWMLSGKRHLTKLAKGSQVPLLMDANPLRYVYLKQLYPDVRAGVPAMLDGRNLDVLEADNELGITRFFFDESSHLLVRVEEKGETSAYFKYVTDYEDYQEIDGVKFPFRIVHNSTEPNAKTNDLRIAKVLQNVPLRPDLFDKPNSTPVVLGGKR